jgi:hypothetical protein
MLRPRCEFCVERIKARDVAVEVVCGERGHLLGLAHWRCLSDRVRAGEIVDVPYVEGVPDEQARAGIFSSQSSILSVHL